MRHGPIASLFAATLLIAGCQSKLADPSVERAWLRLPAVPGQPAAAYFDVIGGSSDASADKLVGVTSAAARRIDLHQSMTGMGGMSTMKPLTEVAVPPYGLTKFAPGGQHAMVYGLDKAVVRGTTLTLRFTFASGRVVSSEARVVAAGDEPPTVAR